ncbi:hypothetical protein HanXRQr2_Chr01g0041411 [Helianthus annuus]|uniref:Uncharacterized protein n=1 Tax=Helianthus annuus TaxID=4232 RepID=A0A9K3JY99_HELAN|nr:hypothetical protein HanXRQr2_Chr01g0041411 [Helianthus annuus]KAJ0958556.1 hypothetical protein HanPSC8_Chr01g0040291 [Helianthus annuus]
MNPFWRYRLRPYSILHSVCVHDNLRQFCSFWWACHAQSYIF